MLRWQGNLRRAFTMFVDRDSNVDDLDVCYPNQGTLVRTAHDIAIYITSSAGSLINHGKRTRAGKRISSRLAESMLNSVTSRRFDKRQRIRRTPLCASAIADPHARSMAPRDCHQ